jgi:hypothetical protein
MGLDENLQPALQTGVLQMQVIPLTQNKVAPQKIRTNKFLMGT